MVPDESTTDARRYPRHDARTLASYRHVGGNGSVDSAGMTTLSDMSLGGLCFESPVTFDLGSRVEVDVQLRDDLVSIVGRVVRVGSCAGGHLVGVEIDNASPNYAEVVEAHLAS